MHTRARSLSFALPLLLALAACRHAGPAAPVLPSAPPEERARVLEVFGRDGKPPPARAGPPSPWEKRLALEGRDGRLKVLMSYEDRAIAESDGRIFENANPFKLREGVYTWVVLEDGVTSFGKPLDAWEVGTRHAHVAQRRRVVAAGELQTDGQSRLRLNVQSGTYALPLIREGAWKLEELRARSRRWFDDALRARFGMAAAFAVEEAVEDGQDAPIFDRVLRPPGAEAIRKLCAARPFGALNAQLCKEVAAGALPFGQLWIAFAPTN